ncbi:RagB/SusD family nutrient uptake outer membrane protein [Desertivirga arenae]|uniref:RagB/SusD family nutrient uptake outer membrane protein n=1 Tax=Desertivirga arenae TaxID=2810309 RepID=UPI001A963960|nr:RagB/SusD family nutrient uptake outer membrane protein [Pedobacter sp. SYSU D00823]
MRTRYIFCLLVICASFSSCKKDFLEVIPKGQQIAEKTEDYALLMNNSTFYQYLNGGGWQAPVLMGDDVAAEATFFNSAPVQTQRLFRWDEVIYDQVTDVASDLRLFLPQVYTSNLVINEVMGSKGGSEQQKKALQAEALATRAWIYFQLVNFYAKPYNAATAGTDPGFPIITKADAMESVFNRGTVQGTYDFIISDLVSAIENLPMENVIRTRFSKPAAQALLGKVYLFMGKPDLALPLLESALANNASAASPARLYDYNVTFAPGGSFLPIANNGPTSPGNNYNDFTESILAKTFGNPFAFGNSGIIISPETAALYSPSDLRLKFYSPTYNTGQPNPQGRLRKYGVSYSKFGVGLPELHLLIAESRARLNRLDAAVADLEAFRSKRMPAADAKVPAAVAGDQNALIRFIFDERVREFAAEGYRWFDMRRMSVDPVFQGITFTHKVYPATATAPVVYTMNQPDRLVLRIPPNIMVSNPGMENNP